MPSNTTVRNRYVRRMLELIRAGNGLDAENQRDLTRLARELRGTIAQVELPGLGRRDTQTLVNELVALVLARYAEFAERTVTAAAEITTIEAAFAQRAADFARAPSERAMVRAVASLLVLGSPPREAFREQADSVAFRIASAIREGALPETPQPVTMARIFGEGPQSRGGVIGQARVQARALTDTMVHAAAEAGRREVYEANGANILRWQSVLDSRTTEGCAVRHGLLYDLDYRPVKHSTPIDRPPPRHFNCRSFLVPEMRDAEDVPASGDTAAGAFSAWLKSLSPDELVDAFGKGRADLYLRGVITKADLVNQQGRVLTLRELRDRM